MAPKKVKNINDNVVKKFKHITIVTKKEIIAKCENGVCVSDLTSKYNMVQSMICTILKKKDSLKAINVTKGVSMLMQQRSQVLYEVESLLLVWINEKQLAEESIGEALICKKALFLHGDLVPKTQSSSSASTDEFKARQNSLQMARQTDSFTHFYDIYENYFDEKLKSGIKKFLFFYIQDHK